MNKPLIAAFAGSILLHASILGAVFAFDSAAPAVNGDYTMVSLLPRSPAASEIESTASVDAVVQTDFSERSVSEPVPMPQKKPVPQESTLVPADTVSEAYSESETVETDSGEAELAMVETGETSGCMTGCGEDIEVVFTLPQELNFPKPQYPTIAKKRKLEGAVQVAIHINKDGTVDKMEILSSSGYEALDNAALAVKDKLRYTPAMEDNRAVDYILTKTVIFRLDGIQ